LEFLVENSDIELHLLYLGPGLPFPKDLPDHDVMFVAIGESEASLPLLKFLERVVHAWPVPVLNMPDRIARLSRDSVSDLLHSVPGIVMPASIRMDRLTLQRVGLGKEKVEFPIIVRPVDSHAGKGLIKAEDAKSVAEYLETRTESEFYIARFVDYRCEDGLFRKYRVVLIDGHPYASHMAISAHWMIHYLNGGMDESAEKRAEEERFMAQFDEDFAVRHRQALRGIADAIGLDYLVIDCAETTDGKLLVFEVDSSAVVHAMDSAELFPYKKPQMRKVSDAFRAMLVKTMARVNPGS
jgi:glutathione synthase/RimK-type ligase-like ATP-grasp enzyme